MGDSWSISENLLSRYCLADDIKWWVQLDEPIECNPIKEMITHLASGELWASYNGIELPSLACDIDALNLEKRARAMIDLLSDPGANEKYVRNMATKLQIKCLNEGKPELSAAIGKAMSLVISSEQKKISVVRREQLKEKIKEMFL